MKALKKRVFNGPIFSGSSFGAYAAADEDEIEDEGGVEDEDQPGGGKTEETVDDDGEKKNVHSDADTFLLFTKPKQKGSVELPAGQVVEFLVGFTNRGESDFVIETLDASFRYPMDYTYHIQNFSAISYHKIVKPKQEATIAYSFIPADSFAGRPIGLSINLAYRDADGSFYFDPVYNETVQIVDFDEGFDTEVFFMYVFMVAGSLLALFLGFTMLSGESLTKLRNEVLFGNLVGEQMMANRDFARNTGLSEILILRHTCTFEALLYLICSRGRYI